MKKYLIYIAISIVSALAGIAVTEFRAFDIDGKDWSREHAATASALIKIRQSFHTDEKRALTILDSMITSRIDTLEFIDRYHDGVEIELLGKKRSVVDIAEELKVKHAEARKQ